MNARQLLARTVDTALEATVVLSFSSVGYDVRSRLFGWSDLSEHPLKGKVALVTGATSGLGLSAATRLAALGASVRMLGRDMGRTDAARAAIVERTGNHDIEIGIADLASLEAVRRYADMIRQYHDRLDVLVNNAGALVHDHQLTSDGLELTVQTHVVAPFLLTSRLLPLLTSTPGSRVVTVSSGGMYLERLDVAHLELGAEDFDGTTAYARAKRAQVVLNEQWADRAAATGVTFHAMHPGWVDTPGLQASLPSFAHRLAPVLRTPAQGADTMVWLACALEPLASNGDFWLDRHRRWTSKVPWTRTSPLEAERLWDWVTDRAGVPWVGGPEPVAAP